MIFTTQRQISLHCQTPDTQASFRRGAFFISLPIKSITRTFDFTKRPTGLTITPYIRLRFRNYFQAHILTILRGLLEQQPRRNLNYPYTYLSLSLKTKIDVLQILMAYYFLVPAWMAWQTFASFPVDRHPLIYVTISLLRSFKRILRVLSSKTCSTVARSALSLVLFYLVNSFCQQFPISLLILWRFIFVSSLVYVFSWYALGRPLVYWDQEGAYRRTD